MDHPRVSIITPVYNGAAYIAETIESVLRQGYQPLEYIVVDDGSRDNTRERLRAFGDAIRVVEQENAGEAAAVNRGFACASGEILAVINADDPVMPGLVGTAVAALAEHPDVAGVYPDWLKIDSTGRVLEVMQLRDYDYSLMLRRHLCLIGPGCFYRRSALGTELPRDPRYRFSGDLHQWLRMGARRPFLHIPQVLATWRFHEGGTSQALRNAEMAAEQVAIVRDLYTRRDLPLTLASLRDEALSAAYFSAALLALHNPEVPARRYMLESLQAKLIWNPPVIQERHRSLRLILFALGTPFTRPLASLYWRMRSGRFTARELGPNYAEWTAQERTVRVRG
jgi:glycosyltransferase involved in cell wall biosynthesis